jgi:RNA polymerase sigma-70 factor (ECF subfamily)
MASSPPISLPDAALVPRVAAGDARAFETLYDRHRGQAFGLALRLTRRPVVAEEVVQDVFLSLWRKADGYDPARGSLSTWLLTAVRNRAIDALRSGARREQYLELDAVVGDLEAGDDVEETALAHERSHAARRLLTELPADQREVIELAYFGGLSQGEIAARVHVPLGTVKGRSRLALERLRRAVTTEPALAPAG